MEFDWNAFDADFQEEFKVVMERLDKGYRKIYTSRINTDLFGSVPVEAYGEVMKLKELANFQIPTARTIVIKPYDVGVMGEIVKALQKAHPEFSPAIGTDNVKISVNPPTEESRKKSVKEAKEYLEHAKEGVRHIRREFIDRLKQEKLPEDQEKKYMVQIDAEVKKMNGKLEELFVAKERELMTI